jgi:hypothetical protein
MTGDLSLLTREIRPLEEHQWKIGTEKRAVEPTDMGMMEDLGEAIDFTDGMKERTIL